MFDQLFARFPNYHIAVLGDAMLDTYWWGNTERISPEAPVPVVALNSKEYRIGGAGNVALNLLALGAKVSMHTVIGQDEDGILLEQIMRDKGIGTAGVWLHPDRVTTNKIRVISRSQHLLRLDHEVSADIEQAIEQQFFRRMIDSFEQHKPDVLILEDYNKGVLTESLIASIVDYCRQHQIITTVDPKRANFFAYKGVDIFKPNLKEAREALNLLDKSVSLASMRNIHQKLHEKLQHAISLVTLSEHGVFYESSNDSEILPAHIRNIADVSGAGDTVIAVASLVYAATRDVKLMAEIANLAGGIVCEEVGTAAIDASKLLAECNSLLKEAAYS